MNIKESATCAVPLLFLEDNYDPIIKFDIKLLDDDSLVVEPEHEKSILLAILNHGYVYGQEYEYARGPIYPRTHNKERGKWVEEIQATKGNIHQWGIWNNSLQQCLNIKF